MIQLMFGRKIASAPIQQKRKKKNDISIFNVSILILIEK